jgi:hypothetical protein
MVPFGEWLPDQPPFQNPGATVITNAVPRTAESYGPAHSLAPVTSAISAQCQGAIYARDTGGNVDGYAGDQDSLYLQSAASWVDVSKAGGYTTADDERWAFCLFGSHVLATNFTDPIQTYSATAFNDLALNAPKARYMARVKDFVMVANTTDATDGDQPQRVWWPAIDAPTYWPTPGTASAAAVQSDYQDLLGEGGWNQGIVGGLSGADVAIFQERCIWRGMYIGPPAIFAFSVVESARGTPAPGSIVVVGPVVYYLADDGFYAFDGVHSVPIGDGKIDRTFWADVDQSYLYRITSAADPLNKIIYWAYPGPQNSGGRPNRIMAYHYGIGRWAKLEQEVEIMVQAMTLGYTLDQLDPFGTLETLPFSLDSRAWTGGRLNLAAFDTSHKLALFSGSALAATLETAEAQLNPKGSAHVSRVWPIVDAVSAQVALGRRDRLADAVTWTAPSSITSTTGSVPLRSTGRYQRARVIIPAGGYWQNAQGVDFEARPAGRR